MSAPFDTNQLNTLIRTRRSVFITQFVPGKVIPDDLIWQLLENANWAPSHKQSEPWRFTVFTGAGLEKLAIFQAELYKELAGERFQQGKYNKLRNNPPQCSHVVAIAMKRTAVRLPEIEEIEAVACAVQNLHLTAHAYGLGGYWSSGGVTYDEPAKEFFGLGPDDRLLGFFQLGYVEVPSDAGKRGPVQEKTVWVRE
ncbi:nitroreductase [Hymenobacter sp. ASUV-10]|uniref:Putative NAD(P)H nitroreductase n=1 Tax=Hymenobacter aranciens TaxID=3063996 RepID=A0ABT9BFU8_9BACT|nr:nitroreductase [Hymenobacter sp. ASUV-10]MDO7877146.1 nitroreductase [Hymenobacter sp. ASUV-10]